MQIWDKSAYVVRLVPRRISPTRQHDFIELILPLALDTLRWDCMNPDLGRQTPADFASRMRHHVTCVVNVCCNRSPPHRRDIEFKFSNPDFR